MKALLHALVALVAAVLALPLQAPSTLGTAGSVASGPFEPGHTAAPASLSTVPAIWPQTERSLTDPPPAHEVALFRRTFSIAAPLRNAELAVFADTRYELWLDGTWIGRGPARFSRQTHEYDVYTIPILTGGEHVLAALVQWSPNVRRSESVQPMLQLQLTYNGHVIAQTDSNWKAIRSPAWNADATLVHAWNLIGATELLDFNRLPPDWMQLSFDDSHWRGAQRQPQPTARYRPRSIPMLANIPMPARAVQRGRLAPGGVLIELQPNAQGEQRLAFTMAITSTLTIKTLLGTNVAGTALPQVIAIGPLGGSQAQPLWPEAGMDGATLEWTADDDWHPDIRRASATLRPGAYALVFRNVPARSWPVWLSAPHAHLTEATAHRLHQGTHAGRRLLLVRPAPDNSAVAVESGPHGYMLTFNRTPSYVVLDLGRVVHGRIEAQVDGPAGAVLDVGWAERTWRNGYPPPYLGSLHPEWNPTDSWVLDGRLRRMTTIDARAGRYVLIAVWGDAPVRLRDVRVIEERYPVTARTTFASGDAQLNAIWRIGRDTAMINMLDAYADPWRERGAWWGDAVVVDRVNEAVFGDNALMRRSLLLTAEQIGDSPGASTVTLSSAAGSLHDYGMLWVQSMRRYIARTGDRSILPECYPAVQRFMIQLAQLEHPNTGLLDVPKANWSESALIDWAAFYSPIGSVVHGQSAPVNAMYYATLRDAAALAGWMEDAPFEVAWHARAAQVRERINELLYLPDQRRYASSIVEGRLITPTLFAQAWPLAYDVVPAERIADTVRALLELISRDPAKPNVQPYGMFWVLEALGRTGHVDEGIALIKLYYGRLLERGATTWWERWDADQHPDQSLSHGWGSAPTWFLSTYVKRR